MYGSVCGFCVPLRDGRPAADHDRMASFKIYGEDLKPGQYRREGLTMGIAYLVVCTTGDHWYVDRNGKKHQPATKAQVAQLFNDNYPSTRCVRFADPPSAS